jgi:hypothetical protein
LNDIVRDALTSHQYDDVVGSVDVNVTDALLAIAHAINRLAAVHEKATAQAAQHAELVMRLNADGSLGHA